MNLLEEANRCLLCKKPRCKENCPINTPIPEIVELYRKGQIDKAGEILFNNNPLSYICSIVCPHEDQCKGNCIRGIKDEPIPFHMMEEEISAQYFKNLTIDNIEFNNHRVAIVGGGPAGITIAFVLAQKGYKVTIFEAHEKIGGVLRYGIPEYRLPNNILDEVEDKLIELGVKIRPNTLIGPVLTLDRLLEDGYDAVFIGTGVWNPRPLEIKGEALGNAHYAIDYLKSPSVYRLGKRVVVIGAGNVAMDAARTAKRNGVDEVFVVYRKGFENMTATKQEIREAKEDGIKFELFRAPLEIKEDGILLAKTENVEIDGRIQTKIIQGEDELFNCDSVIIAVSQSPRNNIVSTTEGIAISKYGLLVTDDLGHTTKKGVFGSGDVVTGAKTVVWAVNHAKIVAESIHKYILSKNEL